MNAIQADFTRSTEQNTASFDAGQSFLGHMLCGGITTQGCRMHDRIWFEVGWDYASYGLTVPDDVDNPALNTGFREGRERFRKPVGAHDRFIRKWLRLRMNAVRRGRQFDADVTPDFLRSIATTICPVTQEPLTYGTLTDTDWSIDRLVNDGAYSCNNLAMMSVRANNAKDRMTIHEILAQCTAGDKCDPSLAPIEWKRLYSLCSGVHMCIGQYDVEKVQELAAGALCIPLIPEYPDHLPMSSFHRLQMVILYYWADQVWKNHSPLIGVRRRTEREYFQLKKQCTPEGVKRLRKIGRQIQADLVYIGSPEKLLWTGKIHRMIFDLVHHLRADLGDIWTDFELLSSEGHERLVKSFHLETKGFIR